MENELLEKLNQCSEEEVKNIKDDWLDSAKNGMKWSWIFLAASVSFLIVLLLMNAAESVSTGTEISVIKTAYWACPLLYVLSCVYGLNGYRAANSLKLVEGGYTKETKKYAVWSIVPSFVLTLPFILVVKLISLLKK